MANVSKAEMIKKPIEKVNTELKKSAWGAAAESLLIMIFGILMVAWPDITTIVIANILGAIFIVSGIYQIINYFVVKGQRDFFNNGLLIGVISLLVGIAAILIGENIAQVFRIIIGIWMVYEALVRMNTAIKMHAVGIKAWSYVLIIAICMLVVGIFVTFNAGAVIQLIGWMMILSGIFGIVGDILFVQYVNSIADVIAEKTKTK
ncbi:DUF308 domain-containing protein [Candidatus Saccharibacteria bacterium]|nr:DUF308 domain-containing protein [Candidatus Saccharibacteria bacterium]